MSVSLEKITVRMRYEPTNGEAVWELTIDEARELQAALNGLFGQTQYVPYYPTWPTYLTYPNVTYTQSTSAPGTGGRLS